MRSKQDVEAYLLRMERSFEEADESTFVLRIAGIPVVLKLSPPLVLLRVDIGLLPKDRREALYETLLTYNAGTLVHAAYGLDGTNIVLASALELENLDYNEIDAVLAEIELALHQQLPAIRALAQA